MKLKVNHNTGKFPDDIIMLGGLEFLNLEENSINGNISETIGQLSCLKNIVVVKKNGYQPYQISL